MIPHPFVRALPAAALALLGAVAHAADPALQITLPALEGQSIPGVGLITSVDNLVVNDLGETLVELDTDHANTDLDSVLWRNGSILAYREGQALALPVGAALDSFDAVTLNVNGDSAWNFFLSGTAGTNDDSGIYFNSTLLIQESDPVAITGLSPTAPFLGFFETKLNTAGNVLILASIDEPNVPGTLEQVLFTLDPVSGAQTLVALEGLPAIGFGGALIAGFQTGPHDFDYNDQGDVLYGVDTDAATAVDAGVLLNNTVLGQEGTASPISGRNWLTLSSAVVNLNNDGDHVYSGSLDGSSTDNAVIIRNGQSFVREGASLPPFQPFLLTSFGSGPIVLADRGEPQDVDPDVLWYGDWDAPDTSTDTGLFLNDKLLLQENVDTIGGLPVTTIRGVQDGYAMSDDGRYIMVEVQLSGNLDAAVLIDRGPWRNLGGSLDGVAGAPRLRGFGALTPGSPVSIDLTKAAPNSPAALIIGLSRSDLPFLGGTLVPTPQLIIYNLPTDATGRLSITANWPLAVPAGAMIHLQYWIADPSAPFGFSASNAVVGTAQ